MPHLRLRVTTVDMNTERVRISLDAWVSEYPRTDLALRVLVPPVTNMSSRRRHSNHSGHSSPRLPGKSTEINTARQ